MTPEERKALDGQIADIHRQRWYDDQKGHIETFSYWAGQAKDGHLHTLPKVIQQMFNSERVNSRHKEFYQELREFLIVKTGAMLLKEQKVLESI